jgi:epoxide hydrolase-like predicted phosphatase
MTIRAVICDIGGVLELGRDGVEPMLASQAMIDAWEKRLGLADGELGARLAAMNRRLADSERCGSLGQISEKEYEQELANSTGMGDDELALFIQEQWDLYLGELNSELAGFLAALRPRYRTALLSNSFVGAREREEERYRFSEIADLIIYSHEVGIAKPDRRIYEIACDKAGVAPQDCIFLDDAPVNCVAAFDFGMHTVLFRNNAQSIEELMSLLG